MDDQNQQPVSADQLRRLEAQVSLLAGRVEYLEKRLGVQSRTSTPHTVPAHPATPVIQPDESAAPSSTQVGTPPVSDVFSVPVAVQPTRQTPATVTAVPANPATPHGPLLPEVPPLDDVPSQQPGPVVAPSLASYTQALQNLQTAPSVAAGSQTIGATQNDVGAPATHRARPHQETNDWERLIGGKWALWVGSLAVFLALAFFLAYTWGSLPPAGRLAIGFVAGAMFVSAGGYARGRLDNWFSEGLTGAGLGIFYLSTWTGAQSYQLLSFEVAFALMAIITIAGVGLAVYYDAVSLSALSTLGGFLTPVLLNSQAGAGSALPFMTYVSLLNIGILLVSLFKRWNGIVWLSFIATFLLVSGWAITSYTTALRWPTFLFVTLLFQLFVGTACFYSLLHKEQSAPRDLLLLYADACIYALAGYGIIGDALGDYPGVFAFGLAVAFAGLCFAIREIVVENATLQRAAGWLAVFFLTITIPIQLDQEWIVIGWSVQAAALLTLGARFNSPLLLRAGQIVWVLSLLPLMPIILDEGRLDLPLKVLFFNERALPLLVSTLATGWMAIVSNLGREPTEASPTRSSASDATPVSGSPPALSQDWWAQRQSSWAAVFALWSVGAGAWIIAQETYLAFTWSRWPSDATWWAAALFIIAILWCGYALAAFALGRRLHHTSFRLGGFLVATTAIAVPIYAGMALPVVQWTPFFNLRWLAYVVTALTLVALGWMISREGDGATLSEVETLGALPAATALLTLWGLTLEVYFTFEQWRMPSPDTWQAGAWFAIAGLWSAFALLMLFLGLTWRQSGLRFCAYIVGALGIVALLVTAVDDASRGWTPLTNLRFLAFALVTSLLMVAAAVINRREAEISAEENGLSTTMTMLATGLLLWGLTQETYETCRYFRGALGADWTRAAQLAISLVWTLCGALLLIGGIIRNYRPVRLAALGLLGLTISKVFLFDLSFLDAPLRILSFGGLGLALIFISWLYSRFGIGRDAVTDNAKASHSG
jgi:uncharacterized membrane protein